MQATCQGFGFEPTFLSRAAVWRTGLGRDTEAPGKNGHSQLHAVGWVEPIAPPPSKALARLWNINVPSCPRDWINAARNMLMKRRVGPVPQVGHEAVLRRVEMNIIHMRGIIPVVSDRVFPEPPLPNATLAFADSAGRPMLSVRQALGEASLYGLPSGREIRVALRQCPDAMHVLRQHDPGINVERRAGPSMPNSVAQTLHMTGKQVAVPVEQVHRKK